MQQYCVTAHGATGRLDNLTTVVMMVWWGCMARQSTAHTQLVRREPWPPGSGGVSYRLCRCRSISVQVRHFQAFRPSAYAGKAHCFIQAVSNTSSALGRSPGLQASIQRNSSNNTAFSSSLTMSVPQDGLSPFTHSSNRLSYDHMSRLLLSGLPVSSNYLARSSHLSNYLDGRRPYR